MSYKITIKDRTWILKSLPSGWIDVKYVDEDTLSRTQLKAIDIDTALQYIWTHCNEDIEPLTRDDLEIA